MNMFKPNLTIKLDPNGKTYTVEASVLVPNGCYVSMGASTGVPNGEMYGRNMEPITLNIVKHDGLCTEAHKWLTFKVAWLPLTIGIDTVIAFVTVNGKVTSAGTKAIPPIGEGYAPAIRTPSVPITQSGVNIQSVSAWVNAMPPGPPRLIAIANVWAPCINYEFNFVDKGGFGFTGLTLKLTLEARLKDGCQKAIFEEPVRFEKELSAPNEYDSIAIEFEGELYFDPLEIAV